MKASNSPAFLPFVTLTLKLVGFILVVSSLLDYLVLLYPFNVQERAWQLAVTGQLVDRGVIPMVGIAFLFAGYAFGNIIGSSPSEQRAPWLDLRTWAMILSSLLGLMFLLLVPIHLNNISFASEQAIKQIGERAEQLESQIQKQSQQVNNLLKNEQELNKLNDAIKSGKIQGDQLKQLQNIQEKLQKLKEDPKALQKQIEEAQTKVRAEKLKAENQARRESVKSSIRTGLSSFLLAIGYIAIGGLGFRSMGGLSVGRRKASAR
jgi:CHASE3 domain sensor protein